MESAGAAMDLKALFQGDAHVWENLPGRWLENGVNGLSGACDTTDQFLPYGHMLWMGRVHLEGFRVFMNTGQKNLDRKCT